MNLFFTLYLTSLILSSTLHLNFKIQDTRDTQNTAVTIVKWGSGVKINANTQTSNTIWESKALRANTIYPINYVEGNIFKSEWMHKNDFSY